MLVGLKRDLREDESTVARLREEGQVAISTDEAQKLAGELGAAAYVEASSLEDSAEKLSEICRLVSRAAKCSKAAKHTIAHSTLGNAAGQREKCSVM